MSLNYTPYRLILGGDLIESFSAGVIKMLITVWGEANGVKNVSSGVVRADLDSRSGVMIYSAHFDSSHWTGRGFRGFGYKHPGELQTL